MNYDFIKVVGEVLAGSILVATLIAKLLPPLAALFSVVWYAMQIKDRSERKRNESKTD